MELIRKLNYLVGKKFRKEIILACLVVITAAAIELLAISVFMPILDLALGAKEGNELFTYRMISYITGFTDFDQVFISLLVFTILVYIVKNAYLSWKEGYIASFSMKVRQYLSIRVMEVYLGEPYTFFLDRNTAEIIRRINGDSASIHEVVWNLITIVSLAVTSVSILVYLAVTNITLSLVLAASVGLCAVTILLSVRKRTRRYGSENLELNGKLIQYVKQAFEGIKEIKILNTEPFFLNEYKRTFQRQADITMRYKLVNALPKYIIETVCIIGIIVYMIIVKLVGTNYNTVVPQLAVFAVAAFRLLPYVNSIYVYANAVMFYRPAVDTIYEDITSAEGKCLEIVTESFEPIPFEKAVEVKNVDFAYQTERPVLKDIALSIHKGDSVGFIGPSGQGKTTLADIVLGLLTPQEGNVCVDGNDIEEHLRGWHDHIGYIPQFIYLSDDTIRRNVAFGVEDQDIDDDKVWKALQEAQLKEFVEGLPEKLDTFVGEQGMRLSGGQRQRIGIARALYRDPSFLVFDEATSALDNETEKEVMAAINSLHGSKTMLIIAHRLTTIEQCDHVFEVDNAAVKQLR